MWTDFGIRLFVEIGPREILTNLISDTVQEAQCLPTCLPSAEAVMFRNATAQLYVKGLFNPPKPVRFVPEPGKDGGAVAGGGSMPTRAGGDVPVASNVLTGIVQREINAFVLTSFGRFLKPAMLNSIRAEYDPQFAEKDLDNLLAGIFPGGGVPPDSRTPAFPAVPSFSSA